MTKREILYHAHLFNIKSGNRTVCSINKSGFLMCHTEIYNSKNRTWEDSWLSAFEKEYHENTMRQAQQLFSDSHDVLMKYLSPKN